MSNNNKNINIPQECFSEQELLDYISGNLSEDKAKIISNHINECEICADVVDGLKMFSEPQQFIANVESINNLIDNRINQKKKKESFFTPLRSIAAAVLILAAVGSVLIINQYSKNINTETISRIETDKTQDLTKQKAEQNTLTEPEPFVNEEETVIKTIHPTQPDDAIVDDLDTYNTRSSNSMDEIITIETKDEAERNYAEPEVTTIAQDEELSLITDTSDSLFFGGLEDNEYTMGTASGASLNNEYETISYEENLDIEEKAITDITSNTQERKTFRSEKKTELAKSDSRPATAQENPVSIADNYDSEDIVSEDEINLDSSYDKNRDNQLKEQVSIISYDSVEIKPIFPGGESALNKYIHQNTNYPQLAIEQNIEGTVYVSFIISENGEITDPTIYQGVDSIIDIEAINTVKQMPKWSPGKHKGKLVKVNYVLPVKFMLF
jgi:periplasmic protein TonB